MSDKNLKQRNQIPKEYKWNIEAMYSDEKNWDKDISDSIAASEDFTKYKGHLTESSDTLLAALKDRDAIWQKIEHAYVYAAMKKDEDNRVNKYQAMNDKANSTISKIAAYTSFFTPELLEASEEKIEKFLDENPKLSQYKFFLESALREKAHILSEAEEIGRASCRERV